MLARTAGDLARVMGRDEADVVFLEIAIESADDDYVGLALCLAARHAVVRVLGSDVKWAEILLSPPETER